MSKIETNSNNGFENEIFGDDYFKGGTAYTRVQTGLYRAQVEINTLINNDQTEEQVERVNFVLSRLRELIGDYNTDNKRLQVEK